MKFLKFLFYIYALGCVWYSTNDLFHYSVNKYQTYKSSGKVEFGSDSTVAPVVDTVFVPAIDTTTVKDSI